MTPITMNVRDVNAALRTALWRLRSEHVESDSRNGKVLMFPGPVITTYRDPASRVLWEPRRDANPVFHLLESIWMLAGRNNVDWLLPFNSSFGRYAEPDGRVHGAYGHRWRHHFDIDQLWRIVAELSVPNTRQAVMAMWDPAADLGMVVNDKPCNTHIYFDTRGGVLNMTVCCRSNDIIWGAYGANAVHFSVLQELLAAALNIEVGVYHQFSNNLHLYVDVPVAADLYNNPPAEVNSAYLDERRAARMPLIWREAEEQVAHFLEDAEMLTSMNPGVLAPLAGWRTRFFRMVVVPLYNAYLHRKNGGHWLLDHHEIDWIRAYEEWAARRPMPTRKEK